MNTILPEDIEEIELNPEEFPLEPTDDSVEIEPGPGPFTYDEEQPNLVDAFQGHPEGEDALKRIKKEVFDMFDDSWDKNSGYREKCAETWALLYGKHKPKNPPYEGCPNPHVPLMLQNMSRLCNRIEGELFADVNHTFTFNPMSPQAEMLAPIVSEHTNWQFANKIPSWRRNMTRAIWIFAVAGDVVCHSYYDPVRKCNNHDILTCDDFVTPYTHVSTAPDFSDVPWVAKRQSFYRAKLQSMSKEWSNVDKVIKREPEEGGSSDIDKPLRDEIADYHEENLTSDSNSEYEIIHWEGWLDLPNQTRDRYCQIIFEKNSNEILKLAIHERASYTERARFKYQSDELQQYQAEIQQYQQMLMQQEQMVRGLYGSIGEMDQQSPGVTDAVMMARQVEAQQPPPPPVRPSWMTGDNSQPEPPEKTPIYMFSHGVCLEPMLGNTGIGLGIIDADYNKAANIALSLFIDAAVLANSQTFITSGNIDFKSPFKVAPGHVNKAKNVMPSDLKNAFIPLSFGAANPQLMSFVQTMLSFGESATNTPDILSGASGKSGETARGFQGRLEQVAAMLTIPAKHFGEFVIQVVRNNCKLNAVFLKDSEIFYVNRLNDSMAQSPREVIQIARDFYDNEYEITLNADMQFRTRAQKISEADEITQLPNAVPALQQNLPFMYHAVKESLMRRGFHQMAKTLLGPEPPLPQTPMGVPMPPMGPPQGQPGGGGAPPGNGQPQ